MSGFGVLSFGTGPAGLGDPVEASAPPTGSAGVRFLSVKTGDYEQDDDTGQLKQIPASRQKVVLALRTIEGSSSALTTFGIKHPRKMGDRFEAEMRNAVQVALRHLTETQKVIRIDQIIVEKGAGGRSKTTVVYTDIASGVDDLLTVES